MKKIGIILITALLAIGTAGTLTYYLMNNNESKKKSTLEQDINDLNNKITNLKSSNLVLNLTPAFYELNNAIWQYDTESGEKVKIADGITPKLSPDKTMLAYSSVSNNNNQIYIYNLNSKEKTIFSDNIINAQAETWSSDSQYLIVDFGTSPERGKDIVNIKTEKLAASFGTAGDSYAWVNNNTIAYTDINYRLSRPGELSGTGLSVITTGNKITKLKTPDNLTDYNFLSAKDGKIYFEKKTVTSTDDFAVDSKIKKTYWSIETNGQNEKQVNLNDTQLSKSEVEDQINQIISALPNYQNYGIEDYIISSQNKNKILVNLVLTQNDKKTLFWDDSTHDYIRKVILIDLAAKSGQYIDKGKNITW